MIFLFRIPWASFSTAYGLISRVSICFRVARSRTKNTSVVRKWSWTSHARRQGCGTSTNPAYSSSIERIAGWAGIIAEDVDEDLHNIRFTRKERLTYGKVQTEAGTEAATSTPAAKPAHHISSLHCTSSPQQPRFHVMSACVCIAYHGLPVDGR